MEKTGWKVLAIIFLVLFIAETLLVLWAINLVMKDSIMENQCAIDVCGYDSFYGEWSGEYDGYNYDESTGTCSCFEGEEITLKEYLKG